MSIEINSIGTDSTVEQVDGFFEVLAGESLSRNAHINDADDLRVLVGDAIYTPSIELHRAALQRAGKLSIKGGLDG